jgi:hypothetical protein
MNGLGIIVQNSNFLESGYSGTKSRSHSLFIEYEFVKRIPYFKSKIVVIKQEILLREDWVPKMQSEHFSILLTTN